MASNSNLKSSLRYDRPIPPLQLPSSSSAVRRGRSKPATSRRSILLTSRQSNGDDAELGRVRVALRLRPRTVEDLSFDADFADCIEPLPESKGVKLRKNNWSSESFKFDEVFTESASQKRVYDAVAKPVVESVLNGYNGTVMAYGQTGTGKTYTMGRLGKEDPSERGIMVRALEDIIAEISPTSDTMAISYIQLYLECIQDLLAPEKNNIPILEDTKTGEVSLPGVSVVKVRDLDQCLQLLQIGEANRHAANTKLNTDSSRSHAFLMVYIQRPVKGKAESELCNSVNDTQNDLPSGDCLPTILKSKLLIVDLAGSERIDKSGSDGLTFEEAKSVNLSLTSLGKCLNALAENSPHIPTRDSKLTRLLRDSFGGSARTSLVITIGPSARHYTETASTVMFGQRAMKIVNAIKLKEEFDYESRCRKLQCQVDHLTAEIERQQKLRESEKVQSENEVKECHNYLAEAERNFVAKNELLEKEKIHLKLELKNLLDELNLQKEQNARICDEVSRLEINSRQTRQCQVDSSTYQKVLADTTQMYEKKIAELIKQIEDEHSHSESVQEELSEMKILLSDCQRLFQIQGQKEIDDLQLKLKAKHQLHEKAINEIESLKAENEELLSGKKLLHEELQTVLQKLSEEEKQRKCLEDEIIKVKKLVSENNFEPKNSYMKGSNGKLTSGPISNCNQSRETVSSRRGTVAKIFEEVGLQKILSLLQSEDLDVQIHAVKVVANLAAEDRNQEKIVEEGGLDALLKLLGSSQSTTIHRVVSGAIANLAMNEMNQGLIMSKGGVRRLAKIAYGTDDSQTLRMVAGAIANLCGNEKLHVMLKEDGGIKALLGMAGCGHNDVIAQIARGIANFAKCESQGIKKGLKKGRSFLIEDGALAWMIANSATPLASTRRHIELALCHLAQNGDNAQDFVSSGALEELVRISCESSREDIRNLARKALNMSPTILENVKRA